MSITDQLKAIQSALDGWASDENGKAFIASDILHMWNMSKSNTQGPRVILAFNGEEARGDSTWAAALHRVDRDFIALVVRGRGFPAERGNALSDTVQNARPLYELFEEARDIIRALIGISDERPVNYKLSRPMSMGDQLMDAYEIHFSVATDIPMVLDQPEELALPAVA